MIGTTRGVAQAPQSMRCSTIHYCDYHSLCYGPWNGVMGVSTWLALCNQ